MHDRSRAESRADVLPDSIAARLLARASELDATLRTGAAIAELRVAAVEAGISARAFDAALAELESAGNARGADGKRRPRPRALTAATAAMIAAAAGAVLLGRSPTRAPVGPGLAMVEESIVLRCLSPGEAAELVRPILRLPSNTVVYSPRRTPRVLTIRATRTQLQEVRSTLDRYEGAGSPACPR